MCTLVSACCSLTPSDLATKHGVFLEEGHHKATFPETMHSCRVYGTEVDKPELTCAVTVQMDGSASRHIQGLMKPPLFFSLCRQIYEQR